MTRILAIACALLASGLTAVSVKAQVEDVEPYRATIVREATPMRCGDMDRFYKVAELDQGTIVHVVGESKLWARVDYPKGMSAFVRADEGRRDGGVVVLTKASKLRAANLAGPSGSWKPLLPERLAEGASLKLIEEVEGRDGSRFYRVEAPLGATGFVPLNALRRATGDEIQNAGEEQATRDEPVQNPDPVEVAQGDEPATPNADPAPGGSDNDTVISLVEPMQPGAEEPRVDDPEAVAAGAGEPDTIEQQPIETPKEPDALTLRDLDESFKAVAEQPIAEAELGALLIEFKRARDEIEDSPLTERLRQRIDRRISMLELRRDYQESLRDLALTQDSISEQRSALEERLAQLERDKVYTYVGTLAASTVYDGRRLPLMYRLVSIDDNPRTLGYIRPSEESDLGNRLGRTVGIVGSASIDPEHQVLVIDAQKISVLDATADASPLQ